MSQVTEHFSWSEFACKNGAIVPQEYADNLIELCQNLEEIRSVVGKPIYIVSGYRTPAYNKKCGGAKSSQHLFAKAADIRVKGLESEQLKLIIEDLIESGKVKQGGLSAYSSFVHYDIRGKRARW